MRADARLVVLHRGREQKLQPRSRENDRGRCRGMMKKFALATAMVLAASGAAMAQSGPNLIEVRQVGFALLSGDFGGINAVVALNRAVPRLSSASS